MSLAEMNTRMLSSACGPAGSSFTYSAPGASFFLGGGGALASGPLSSISFLFAALIASRLLLSSAALADTTSEPFSYVR